LWDLPVRAVDLAGSKKVMWLAEGVWKAPA
jgi:hypothetical protein